MTMKTLRLAVLLVSCCLMTGCFQLEGVHVLHNYGESDTGSYRIAIPPTAFTRFSASDDYGRVMRGLRTFSRPSTRKESDIVYVEDNTGRASMEHFYETARCQAVAGTNFEDRSEERR